MEAVVASHPIAAWKTFTNYPDLDDNSGNAWRFDDRDPNLAPVGNAFIAKCIELGRPVICVHKGFSERSPYASPDDIGPAAKTHPDAQFVVYHSGYEPGRGEGPYADDRAATGVNRLIKSMRDNGIGPNQNVHAELGSTWWTLMRSPDEAAHVLGKLLVHVGENNVLWGTDALFYGSPQDQIQAFRAFQITPEFQARYGYPALTDDIKRKVLGRNGLRLYGVEPINSRCAFTREELEQARLAHPSSFETYGPTTAAEQRAFRAYHRGWP
jgi:predicted TIM-barrel fold metal-dependent hydrolase